MPDNIKVLIVDDDTLARQVLKEILSKKGFITIAAGSCQEAFQAAVKEHLDAALIDLNLPDGNGLDILSAFKEKHPDIVCFIMTGFASMENAVNSLKNGADDFFVKPLVLEEVLHRLTLALEKKELKKKLIQTESRYRLMVDQIQDGVVILDAQACVIHVNPAIERLFGVSKGELKGKEISILFPATDDPDYHKDFQGYLLDSSHAFACHSLLALGRTGDDRSVPVEISLGEMLDSEKETFICIIRDISERKEAEARLIRQHEELDALFKQVEIAKREWEQTMDCINDMVLLVDTQGRIKRFNNALITFLRIGPGDVLGNNWLEILGTYDMVPQYLNEGNTQTDHYHAESGRWFVFSRYKYMTKNSEEEAGQVITIHDTTSLKKASQEMEEMNDAINLQHLELKKTMGELDRKSTRLNSSHTDISRMPSSA